MAFRGRHSRRQLLRLIIRVSALLIFAALGLTLFNAYGKNQSDLVLTHSPPTVAPPSRLPIPSLPDISTAPGCEIWKDRTQDWKRSLPLNTVPAANAIPPAQLGSSEFMGRHAEKACIPAYDRLAPFGHLGGGEEFENLPWETLKWGDLQHRCFEAHQAKMPISGRDTSKLSKIATPLKLKRPSPSLDDDLQDASSDELKTGRTAVVLRAWDEYEYSTNRKAWIRALITELVLDSAGRFQVFLLVDVKNPAGPGLLSDEAAYSQSLQQTVPEEFRDMALLFDEHLLREWYPKVSEHKAKDQMYQALQIFSYSFPEFDYIWQLEMDARFTGHAGRMLEDAVTWAEQQPRKNLWERNARFYIPALWNDNYDDFSNSIDQELSLLPETSTIWGPPPTAHQYIQPRGPPPPQDRSNTTWGINEPPDLITLAPIINPISTSWSFEKDVYNFSPASKKSENLLLPRRMAMISITRTSRRLLRLISTHQRSTGAWLVSEATPETFSLLHGLKAVYVPHLIAFNLGTEVLTPEKLDKMVHRGPVESRAGGKKAGFLWCGKTTKVPEKRWLSASYFWWTGQAINFWYDYVVEGVCMPPMVLHPVKSDGKLEVKGKRETR